ncbi:MAG: hypothetical protein II819_04905 [Fibrobacter sp.]|nr:hypothetical protein [Fibrobacter sp.]
MENPNGKIILYSSYQVGESLPGYVRFALEHLTETGFKVVLLTNRRELSAETLDFLNNNNIFLYQTENHGFDFGMWRRFLKDLAAGRGEFVSLTGINRLLLMNDSIVYFQNRFKEFVELAESNTADAISLTKSKEYHPHLQSFFLYLKPEALGAFFMHLLETPEQENYYDVVHKLEIGLGKAFIDAEVTCDSLFKTGPLPVLEYPNLLAQGCGFIKRRLLQGRQSVKEKLFYVRRGASDVLNADYHQMVIDSGLAPDFKEEWLPSYIGGSIRKVFDKIWEKPLEKFGAPIYNKFVKPNV